MKSDGHEARFAYALWGIAWWIIGIYDALLDEHWTEKFFASIITIAFFTLWIGYELSLIKFNNIRKAILYFIMYVFGINNWNVAWLINAYMFMGWRPGRYLWLAPGITVPICIYWLMTITMFIVWLGFGIFINIRKKWLNIIKILNNR